MGVLSNVKNGVFRKKIKNYTLLVWYHNITYRFARPFVASRLVPEMDVRVNYCTGHYEWSSPLYVIYS